MKKMTDKRPTYATGEWVYIYYIRGDATDGAIFYDSSIPRDLARCHSHYFQHTLGARLARLRDFGHEPFYTVGARMPGVFY